MRVRRLAVLVAGTVLVAGGCELASTTAPAIEPRVVVHAVLNPAGTVQTVLVERTLRSVARTSGETTPYEPIGDARVILYGPRQDSVIATRATGTGVSSGVYRAPSITVTDGSAGNAGPNVLRVRPGERYRLRVETSIGVVTGETIIPVGGPVDAVRRTFNVDRDTLRLNTGNVQSAAGYYLRHETTSSVHEQYVAALDDALVLPLAENPDWSFSFAHESIYPGITQRFSVVAVDTNYFRYYVAGYDPFGDDTRGNTLTGGVGLFGAVATLMFKTMDLTADIDTPIEGRWAADRPSATLPATMTLYSSPYFPSARPGGRVSLTGTGQVNGVSVEAYGYTENVGATLQFFPLAQTGQPAAATGSMTGGDLVLTDTRTGQRVTYQKR
jgi:hypothetical protein